MSEINKEHAQTFRKKIFERLPELETVGQTEVPNQKFWEYYREKKEIFHSACIYVRKEDDSWQIFASEFKDREAEEAQRIQDWQTRFPSKCNTCGRHCDIEQSIQSNHVRRYRFLCRHCGKSSCSGIPHKYVEYCIAQKDLKVFPRPSGDSGAYYRTKWIQKWNDRWQQNQSVSVDNDPPPCQTCGKILESFKATECSECGISIFIDISKKESGTHEVEYV